MEILYEDGQLTLEMPETDWRLAKTDTGLSERPSDPWETQARHLRGVTEAKQDESIPRMLGDAIIRSGLPGLHDMYQD
eukprot:COSAG06_NODE_67195_length_252_cov_1.019608_1_plen_77_part_10